MAGTFPSLSDGNPVKAGYVHSLQIRVRIQQFRSGAEQRHAYSGLLNAFRLPYSRVRWTDVTAMRDFFITQKGAFDSSWTMNLLDPSTQLMRDYENLAFDQDEFSYTEASIGRYDLNLSAVQTVGESVTPDPQTSYPTISGGVRVQLPFRSDLKYKTERNDMEHGRRFAYAVWPTALRSWPLEYSVITDAEVKTLVDAYLQQGGPLHSFSFTDPNTAATYENCRYGEVPIEITRVSPNINRVTLTIEQFRAA